MTLKCETTKNIKIIVFYPLEPNYIPKQSNLPYIPSSSSVYPSYYSPATLSLPRRFLLLENTSTSSTLYVYKCAIHPSKSENNAAIKLTRTCIQGQLQAGRGDFFSGGNCMTRRFSPHLYTRKKVIGRE